MNIPRMQALSTYLRNHVTPEHFNMGEYWLENSQCGCTIGHAANMPEFNLLGLKKLEDLPPPEYGIPWVAPIYAFQVFMELTGEQRDFITGVYLTNLNNFDVADRINAMIKDELAHMTPVVVEPIPC